MKKAAPFIAMAAPFVLPGVGTALTAGLGGIGSSLGGAGNILGGVSGLMNVLGSSGKQKSEGVQQVQEQTVKPAQAEEFIPTRPQALGLPSSLAEIGSYTPEQQRSALATKGLNQGLGEDENAYYKNLVQRSLIGDKNQVTGDVNSLLPVEQQYFGRQGINMGNINSFLKGLSG